MALGEEFAFTVTISPALRFLDIVNVELGNGQEQVFVQFNYTPISVLELTDIYTSSGTYTITASLIQDVYGEVTGQGTTSITVLPASLTLEPAETTVAPNEPVIFTATIDPAIQYNAVRFDFDDGSPGVEVASSSNVVTTSHTYTSAGVYTPTATLLADVYGGAIAPPPDR
ncbi:MAG: PKD domain-containing protein [Chloroflexaceae bacterium]|nr:PKD domain-containing protein [Chloroflexaceae bacterium]